MFAPLEGWRHVKVTDRHTAVDYAHTLKDPTSSKTRVSGIRPKAVSQDTYASMTSSPSGSTELLILSCSAASRRSQNDMRICNRHRGGNDERKLDEDDPAGISGTQIMDFQRACRVTRYDVADFSFHLAVA